MLKHAKEPKETREILLSLLATSSTLAGIAVALVGLVNLRANGRIQTFADDLFFASGLGFVIVCYLIFFAMRRLESGSLRMWTRLIDVAFPVSLTLFVVAGFFVVYVLV